MHGIVLLDGVGEELFSGASILSPRPALALVVEDDEEVEDDEPCPETLRSGVFARVHSERVIEVAVAW